MANTFREFYRRPRNKKIFWGSLLALSLIVGGVIGLRYYLSTMAERHYRRAVRRYKNREVEKAIAEYKVVAEKYAHTKFADDALVDLGEIALKDKNLTEANEYFRKVTKEYPDADKTSRAAFRLAKSEEEFIRVIVLYPRSEGAEESYIALADLKVAEGKMDEAKKILKELPQRFPEGKKFDVALFKTGEIEFLNRDYGKAARAYLALISNFKNSELFEKAYFAYADAVKEQKDLPRSIMAYQETLYNFPRNPRAEAVMFLIGDMQLKTRLSEAARETYTRFLDNYPTSASRSDVYAAMGESYLQQDDYLNAIPEFEKAINTTADVEKKGQYYWQIALCNENQGNFIQTENILDYLIKNFPEHPVVVDASFKRGRVVFSQQSYPRAVEVLETLLSEHPEHEKASEAQYLIGKSHFNLKAYEPAIKAYQKVIGLYPKSEFRDDTQFGICDVFFAQGENSLARTAYLLAMDNFPTSPYLPHAHYRIGDTFRNQGNFVKAIDYYRLATTRYPDFVRGGEVSLWIADFFYNERNFEKALDTYQDFFNTYNEDIYRDKALFRIGRCQYEIHDFPAAARSFNQLLEEFSPGEYTADAMYFLADSYYQQNDFLNSSQYYDQAFEKFPDYINRYFQNGRSEQFLRLFDKAIENYRRVAASDYNDKKHLDAQYRIGYLMMEKGEYEQASRFMQDFIKRHPDSKYVAAANAKIGDVLYAEGDYARAINWYTRALEAGQLQEEAKSRLAFSYYQKKNFDAAEKTYSELKGEAADNLKKELEYRTKLADTYYAGQKFKKALELYESAIEILTQENITDETMQWALYQKGSAQRELRDFDAAEKTFVDITQNFPESLWAEQAAQEQLTVRWQKRQKNYFPERT